MGEAYIRAQNANPSLFTDPAPQFVPPDQRALINEAAFIAFEQALRASRSPLYLTPDEVDYFLALSAKRVMRLRQADAGASELPARAGLEVREIAQRLFRFFRHERSNVTVRPLFPGCGWIVEAEGDILSGPTLYEVKAGDRHFRLSDLRQLLCYCALNFSSKTYEINRVSLINPRTGAFLQDDLDALCLKISGTASADVLTEIIAYVSEPISRYQPTE